MRFNHLYNMNIYWLVRYPCVECRQKTDVQDEKMTDLFRRTSIYQFIWKGHFLDNYTVPLGIKMNLFYSSSALWYRRATMLLLLAG